MIPGSSDAKEAGDEREVHAFGADVPRGSETTFRRLAALSSDWYWRQDASFRFTHFYLSTEAENLAGYQPNNSVGRARWELPDVEPITSSWEAHRAALEAHVRFRDFEYRRVDADGCVRYISVSGEPVFDEQGRFDGYQGVGRNITERKAIEEALRESESRFRSLAALSSDWYWRQDSDLRFTYLSSEVEALAGYSADSSLGKRRWELPNVTPLSCSWKEHHAVLEAQQKFHDFEYARIEAGGDDRYISVSGEPVMDRDGRFIGYQGVARNVTERRRIENELRSRQEVLDLAQNVASAAAFDWQASDARAARRWSSEFVALHRAPPRPMPATLRSYKRLVAASDWPLVKEELRRRWHRASWRPSTASLLGTAAAAGCRPRAGSSSMTPGGRYAWLVSCLMSPNAVARKTMCASSSAGCGGPSACRQWERSRAASPTISTTSSA